MEFTPADIKRLYGQTLYKVARQPIPASEPNAEELPPVDEALPASSPTPAPIPAPEATVPDIHQGPVWLGQGTGVNWKMKPTAKLAILLSEGEFSNRELTARLRKAVERVGLDTSLVGFGVFPADREFHVTDCPVSTILICSQLPKPEIIPHAVEDKRCWFAPNLQEAASSREFGQALLDSLTEAAASLPS